MTATTVTMGSTRPLGAHTLTILVILLLPLREKVAQA
jgi:hypothetical protein